MPPFLEFLPAASAAVLLAFPLLLLGLAIPYAILRTEDARSEQPDPHLGPKVLFYFVFSLAVLLVLIGLTAVVLDVIAENDPLDNSAPSNFGGRGRSSATFVRPAQRVGMALMMSGFVVGGLHVVLILAFTNDLRRPGVRRMFLGWRLAIHSLVNFTAFTVLVVQVFQEDLHWPTVRNMLCVLAVWMPAALGHLVLLLFAARGPTKSPIRVAEEAY